MGLIHRDDVKSLLKLGAPVAAAHLANMTMQLADTMFVGRLGAAAIGGVSIGNALHVTIMVLGIGLLLGLDYVASHAFGAGKLEKCHDSAIQALYVATLYSLPLMLLMFFASNWFSFFGVTPDVAAQAGIYTRWLTWGLWPLLLFTALRQYLQAMGSAAPVMVIMVLANVVNALGNWIFVFGKFGMPRLGVAGSGLATCIARVYMLAALVIYIALRDRKSRGLASARWAPSLERMRELVRLGLPAAVQLTLEVGVFASATMLAGRLGATALAAHQIVLLIASCTFMIPLGLSAAAAVRVGQALGQGHRHRAARVGWTAFFLGAAFMSVSGATLYATSRVLLRAFTTDQAVIALGSSLLLIAAFFQLFDGLQVVGSGVLRGIGNTRSSMWANLVGHWFLGLPAGAALCFLAGWGAHGLWIGLSIGLISVALMLLVVWSRKSRELI